MSSKGRLVLYVGPMFAGKSSHLIKAAAAHERVLALKPGFDTRDGAELVSRDGSHFAAQSVRQWPARADNYDHIVLDEVQFMVAPHYEGDIVTELQAAKLRGATVTVGGLDSDYRQQPFEIVSKLMQFADDIIYLEARCHTCNAPARWTAKTHETGRLLETGDQELYEARCNEHWCLPEKP